MRTVFALICILLMASYAWAAIDSEDKRRSVPGVSGVIRAGYPIPDGAIDAADRAHIAGRYRGFLDDTDAPSVSSGTTNSNFWTFLRRRRR